jgi:small conductance mechanosensitive channel
MVIGELGYDIAPLIASAGIIGVALGFGRQSLVKDFLLRHLHDPRGPVRRR